VSDVPLDHQISCRQSLANWLKFLSTLH
jgi:hypothetical protein